MCEFENLVDVVPAIGYTTAGLAVTDLDNDGLFEVIVAV